VVGVARSTGRFNHSVRGQLDHVGTGLTHTACTKSRTSRCTQLAATRPPVCGSPPLRLNLALVSASGQNSEPGLPVSAAVVQWSRPGADAEWIDRIGLCCVEIEPGLVVAASGSNGGRVRLRIRQLLRTATCNRNWSMFYSGDRS
jgi:hypothetical protein